MKKIITGCMLVPVLLTACIQEDDYGVEANSQPETALLQRGGGNEPQDSIPPVDSSGTGDPDKNQTGNHYRNMNIQLQRIYNGD